MLKTNKSTTLNGHVTIEETLVITLNASISPDDGGTHISMTLQNKELYVQNLEQCRGSIDEFIQVVRNQENSVLGVE